MQTLADSGHDLGDACVQGDMSQVVRILATTKVDINDIGWWHSPLMLAAGNGYDDIFEVLVKHNANIFAKFQDGSTLLHYAASSPWKNGRGMGATLRFLLDIAKTDSRIDINARTTKGETPVSMAINDGTVDSLEQLLQAGANPSPLNSKGKTPLFQATWRGDVERSEILLRYKPEADLNIQDIDGNTATHSAVVGGVFPPGAIHFAPAAHRSIILNLLMKAKANLSIKNRDEQTPYDVAMKKRRFQLATVLLTETTRIGAVQALCMGIHPRLGSGSRLSDLDAGVIQIISSYL
jgi:ankyrin repeat protein